MQFTINVDCTPEEARRFVGLPDLTPVHDLYLDRVKRTLDEGVTPDMIEAMMKSWMPMGEAGLAVWRKLLDQVGTTPKG